MDSFKWALYLVGFCIKVSQTSPWTAKVTSRVKGLPGSCVVIPCSYDYPNPDNEVSDFTGMWLLATHELIYHPDKTKVIQQFKNRTELVGNIGQKDCSLKIEPLQESDRGPFYFRIEILGHDKFSFKENTVSIEMRDSPISLSVEEEVEEGQNVSASCSVNHSCPTSPPVFTWSHPGTQHFHTHQLDNGQWTATSTLYFQPTSADHNKVLQCTVKNKGVRPHKACKGLNVKYAPANVKVEHKSDIKEGKAVQLRCSSDANPSATSYQWHDETGAQLHQGDVYMLQNVSRHTGALYCTATNEVGRGKSNPVWLNVLYAPEIKKASSCSSDVDMIKCVCIAEARPASMVYFVLSDRVLPSFKVDNHGSVTIGTLQAEFESFQVVYCLANNTLGHTQLPLSQYQYHLYNNKIPNLYIIIACVAGGILVILVAIIGVVKSRRRSDDVPHHISTVKSANDVALPECAAPNRNDYNYQDFHCSVMQSNEQLYGNMGDDLEDETYANM